MSANQTNVPTDLPSEDKGPSQEGHVPALDILCTLRDKALRNASSSVVPQFTVWIKEADQDRLFINPYHERLMDPMGVGASEDERTKAGDFVSAVLSSVAGPWPPLNASVDEKKTMKPSEEDEEWGKRLKKHVIWLHCKRYPKVPYPHIRVSTPGETQPSTFEMWTWRPMTNKEKREGLPSNITWPWLASSPNAAQGLANRPNEATLAHDGTSTQVGGTNNGPLSGESSVADNGSQLGFPEHEPGQGNSILILVNHNPSEGRFSYMATDEGREVPRSSGGPGTRAHDVAEEMVSELNSMRASSRPIVQAVHARYSRTLQSDQYDLLPLAWRSDLVGSESARSD